MVCSAVTGSSRSKSTGSLICRASMRTGMCSPSAVWRPGPHVYRNALRLGVTTCAQVLEPQDDHIQASVIGSSTGKWQH